jgi:uncharacterized coiled-coil protein SlyX
MKEQLAKRLAELKTEFASGQKMIADLEAQQANLRDTLLRISGAIQILEEEIGKANEEAENSHNEVEVN